MSTKLIAAITAALLLISGAVWVVTMIQKQAVEEALNNVREANTKASNKASSAQITVEGCYAGGGSWDRTRGVCDKPTSP